MRMEPTRETTVEWERRADKDVPAIGAKMYCSHPKADLWCLVSRDGPKKLWHLSVRGVGRVPTFDEVASARDKFTPDRVTMAMYFPPREQYVNFEPHTLHLFETAPDERWP